VKSIAWQFLCILFIFIFLEHYTVVVSDRSARRKKEKKKKILHFHMLKEKENVALLIFA
jgi:hypothetical protein